MRLDSEATYRRQRSRPGLAEFMLAVLDRYGAVCTACDLTGARLLEAAHLIDEGWSRNDARVGVPMCPNHHRLLDKGILRIQAGRWECNDPEYRKTVTREGFGHLAAQPSPEAVAWKEANPLAGRFGR